MKPEYIKLNGCLVNASQILFVRPSRSDEQGTFAVALSGTRILYLDEKEGKALWDWCSSRAVEASELGSL